MDADPSAPPAPPDVLVVELRRDDRGDGFHEAQDARRGRSRLWSLRRRVARAQDPPRAEAGSATLAAVGALIDSARAAGDRRRRSRDRALSLSSRSAARADPRRGADARDAAGTAKRALAPATEAEILAGADAVAWGVFPEATLVELRRVRSGPDSPFPSASSPTSSAVASGGHGVRRGDRAARTAMRETHDQVRQTVERDIALGSLPAAATADAARRRRAKYHRERRQPGAVNGTPRAPNIPSPNPDQAVAFGACSHASRHVAFYSSSPRCSARRRARPVSLSADATAATVRYDGFLRSGVSCSLPSCASTARSSRSPRRARSHARERQSQQRHHCIGLGVHRASIAGRASHRRWRDLAYLQNNTGYGSIGGACTAPHRERVSGSARSGIGDGWRGSHRLLAGELGAWVRSGAFALSGTLTRTSMRDVAYLDAGTHAAGSTTGCSSRRARARGPAIARWGATVGGCVGDDVADASHGDRPRSGRLSRGSPPARARRTIHGAVDADSPTRPPALRDALARTVR